MTTVKKTLFNRILLLAIAFLAGAVFAFYRSGDGGAARCPVKGRLTSREAPFFIKWTRDTLKRRQAWNDLDKDVTAALEGFKGRAGLVIKDLDTGREIAINGDAVIPSASIVKIPIMMSYYQAAADRKVDLNATVRLGDIEKVPGSGVLKNGSSADSFTVEELIELMIVHSDNTAANALIDMMGLKVLDGYFLRLGLRHTNLVRKMMDFEARKKGVENYTTAGDMAHLLEKLYRGRFIDTRTSERCLGILAGQKVNDRIPKKLPGGTVVAHKTGLEKGICHDVGIVYTDKGDFLISVVVRHSYRYAHEAKRLISKISLLTYNYYNKF